MKNATRWMAGAWAFGAVLVLNAGAAARGGDAGAEPGRANTLRAETNRDAVAYEPGDDMIFTFRVDYGDAPLPEGGAFLDWTRTGDDGATSRGRVEVVDGSAQVKTTLDQPGFVRILAKLVDARGQAFVRKGGDGKDAPVVFDGGAGVRPEKLESIPEPDDFDAFWTRQKARLADVPMKAELTKLDSANDKFELYAVTIDCAGPRPVTGYLSVPVGAKEKSLGGRARYMGYGTGKQNRPQWLDGRFITFDVNAHGFELERDAAYYKEFENSIKSNGKTYAFDPVQNADPETAYFNGMALRLMRSLEYLKSRPEWNGAVLEAHGGSQGGLQAVWAGGLDPDVTLVRPDVPWCCDIAGKERFGRLAGWRPEFTPALGYYDAVHHARRVKARAEIGRAGLGDYVCPPSGIAILYNNFAGPKKITYVQGSTHGDWNTPKEVQRWVREG